MFSSHETTYLHAGKRLHAIRYSLNIEDKYFSIVTEKKTGKILFMHADGKMTFKDFFFYVNSLSAYFNIGE